MRLCLTTHSVSWLAACKRATTPPHLASPTETGKRARNNNNTVSTRTAPRREALTVQAETAASEDIRALHGGAFRCAEQLIH